MDMRGNYRNYREVLAQASPPCVPFIGLYLTDFTFLDDGNPDHLKKPQLINIVKRRLISDAIERFLSYAATQYCLIPISAIQAFLLNCESLDDTTLYKHSLKLERLERRGMTVSNLTKTFKKKDNPRYSVRL